MTIVKHFRTPQITPPKFEIYNRKKDVCWERIFFYCEAAGSHARLDCGCVVLASHFVNSAVYLFQLLCFVTFCAVVGPILP